MNRIIEKSCLVIIELDRAKADKAVRAVGLDCVAEGGRMNIHEYEC